MPHNKIVKFTPPLRDCAGQIKLRSFALYNGVMRSLGARRGLYKYGDRVMNDSILLIVDVQVGVMKDAWNAEAVVSNIAKVLEKAQSSQTPVIWVQHDDEELVAASPEWEIVSALSPTEGEPILSKHFNSAFEHTELKSLLSGYRAQHIVLVGAASHWCIRATAYSVLERGYDLTLVKDAHTTEDMDMGDGTTIFAKDIIRELNVGINWVSYPDRKNQIIAADDLEFDAAI